MCSFEHPPILKPSNPGVIAASQFTLNRSSGGVTHKERYILRGIIETKEATLNSANKLSVLSTMPKADRGDRSNKNEL
ncbi:hypothetical protein LguiA_005173 [Lonicera macranthoides]